MECSDILKIKMVLKLLLLKQQPIYHWCACLVAQSRQTLCNPVECSLQLSLFFQEGMLDQVAIYSYRGSFQPMNWILITCISCTAGGFFTCWATREALILIIRLQKIEVVFLILSYEPAQALLTTHLLTQRSVSAGSRQVRTSFICHLLLLSCH